MPLLLGSTEPASAVGNIDVSEPVVENFALSPNTFGLLQAYLNSDTNAQADLKKCAEEMRRAGGSIDPSILYDTTFNHLPTYDQATLNDAALPPLRDLTSDEELAKVMDSSDDDGDNNLTVDMVSTHVWAGCNIKYVVHAHGRTLRLTAEQLQERFAGTRQALWGYWHSRRGSKIPPKKIRRHLRKMGISGSFARCCGSFSHLKSSDDCASSESKALFSFGNGKW
ncbi:hypothetical protein NCC49_005985 [Naganishia albida]|nr:hypothetical protein NCC49_005985 [Naganishia albida]